MSKIIEYLLKMKYRGKPKPRNSSYLVFSQRAMGDLSMTLRQHLQKVFLSALRRAFMVLREVIVPGL
jgi:hypothetical protein